MYHFLVSGAENAWSNGSYEFEKSRFLEYTNTEVEVAFRVLTASHINALKSYPCLFAQEGETEDLRIGRVLDIAESEKRIRIEFEFRDEFRPIAFESLRPALKRLDIRKWEINRTHWAIKEVDLFDVLSEFNIDYLDQLQELEEPQAPVEGVPLQAANASNLLPEIAPAEFSADSVQGFIDHVLTITRGMPNKEVFYRGHSARARYKLIPSLFRKDGDGNYLHLDREDVMFRELLISNHADFADDENTLGRLIRMQHYSLPTRLLDITSHPLIALYFACKSNIGEDGEVILFGIEGKNIKYFDSDTVSAIANLACLPQSDKTQIKWLTVKDEFNAQEPVKRLLHFIKAEKPFFEPQIVPTDLNKVVCVKGKRTNSRISSQVGAFLLFGYEAVLEESGSDAISINRISITSKETVLKELDMLNINDSTVFPYIENSAKYIAEKYKFRPA